MRRVIGAIVILLLIAVFYVLLERKSAPKPISQVPITTVQYACREGKTLKAEYHEGSSTPASSPDQPPVPGGSVLLTLNDGTTKTLSQTISADGVRYANQDESFVFWSKGNGALVLENNVQKTYIGCVAVAPLPAGSNLSQVYGNSEMGFTLRFPSIVASSSQGNPNSYKVDQSYVYYGSPTMKIYGVKFTVPEAMATGTNLGSDSYISVESIPQKQVCTANLFLDGNHPPVQITDGDVTYSYASSSNAGAGNRYEEQVFAIPGTNPCMAVRYLVHYSVFENYPEGTIKRFDMNALLKEFDSIRRTLVVNQ